ncbi:4-hydroxy-3-methylbut-2-enyl diphosphate reductase, partial [Candidatus Fermentibacterales bacterium]|nr:4-hydroxy-3-methylbut-2-enyl diphosphate reductase [Candidatus Fermentibacterales bacterium]
MSVTVARSAGFCWGVRRAVDCVLDELKKGGRGPFLLYGPLVHNPQVLEALRQRGVDVWNGEEESAPASGVLFLRTHGVSAGEMERLSGLPTRLRNLVCPRVARVQALARKHSLEGDRDILILGDPDHSEVIALLSYAGPRARLISGLADLDALPPLTRPVLLAQTTQNELLFERVAERLAGEYPDLLVERTICDSTDERQEELRALCPRADCVVVVGGANSANTSRLTAIAAEEGLPAFQVETADDLPLAALSAHRRILVTAGASTPSWVIGKVRERLLEMQGSARPGGGLLRFLRTIVFSSLYVAPAALALGAASGVAMGGEPWIRPALPACLAVLGLHSLNAILETARPRFASFGRDSFVRANRSWLLAVALLCIPASIALGAMQGLLPAAGYAGVWLLFVVYSLPLAGGGGGL